MRSEEQEREAFEAWKNAQKELTFPPDYDRSRFAGWGEGIYCHAEKGWFARAALARAPDAGEAEAVAWLPIATAPKDGTTVMLWERYNDVPVVGFYSDRRGKWYADTSNYDANGDAIVIDKLSQELISHWMPLPAAPAFEASPTKDNQ